MSNYGRKIRKYNLFYSLAIEGYAFCRLVRRFVGKIMKSYYFEDFVRVYPDGLSFNQLGFRKRYTEQDEINFINHSKVYYFASQFVRNKIVTDIGCGSGYGCDILQKAGAKKVYGADASISSVNFAEKRYKSIDFVVQDVTNLKQYESNFFDVTVCSEVLEHIKEYNMEEKAVHELKRVTKEGGLIIIGTPNTEIILDHGFSFEEINSLMRKNFLIYSIFENALLPLKKYISLWEKRKRDNSTGVIVSEKLDLSQISLLDGVNPITKKGLSAGSYQVGKYRVNLKLLYNPISWIILAIK